jgi:intracellular sulfur oxidation DsrE/DsrF family protein
MFKKLNGKHRVVYDSPEPNGVSVFVWAKVFLLTNAATGTPEKDSNVVIVLRHNAIPYAFNDAMWKKYKFSEMFKGSGDLGPVFQAADAATAATMRNPMWNPKSGDFKAPGLGPVPIGINELQASGVQFCVCNMAMTVYSNVVAMQTGGKAEDILKDWTANVLPGVQVVPSGVWALGRAQEKQCAYIFAG